MPIHTISDELLIKILKRNNISDENIKEIELSVKTQKQIITNILQSNMFEFNSHRTFNNIQILILEKHWVMISKNKSPSIHFTIHHPKLRNAIECWCQ